MNHKDLDVWKAAMELSENIYRETANFPQHEQFGITAQIRRAAVSVAANIAEGSGRHGDKEFIRFLYISLGSLAELETLLILSNKVGYLSDELHVSLQSNVTQCSKLTYGLIKYLKSK